MLLGDLVRIDDDGYLKVIGRTDDFIIRGGKNISGPGVEQQVATHPAVALGGGLHAGRDLRRARLRLRGASSRGPDIEELVSPREPRRLEGDASRSIWWWWTSFREALAGRWPRGSSGRTSRRRAGGGEGPGRAVRILDDLMEAGPRTSPPARRGSAASGPPCGVEHAAGFDHGAGEHEHGTRSLEDEGSLAGEEHPRAGEARLLGQLPRGGHRPGRHHSLSRSTRRAASSSTRATSPRARSGKEGSPIGHFPFVPALREAAARLEVLELSPQQPTPPAGEAETIVPQADIVAIMGTAFIDDSLGAPGPCRPDSFVVVLGPTTPLSPVRSDYGADVISACGSSIPSRAALASEGATFREIKRHPPAHHGAGPCEGGRVSSTVIVSGSCSAWNRRHEHSPQEQQAKEVTHG